MICPHCGHDQSDPQTCTICGERVSMVVSNDEIEAAMRAGQDINIRITLPSPEPQPVNNQPSPILSFLFGVFVLFPLAVILLIILLVIIS